MKKPGAALFCAIFFLLIPMVLSGCGDLKDAKESTLTVDKKGIVTEALVEDFPLEKYNKTELENSVKELIQSYNKQAGSEKVTLAEIEFKEGIAKVFLRFQSGEDYRKFNQVDFFAGTVKDAVAAGYSFEGKFLDGEGKEVAKGAVPDQCQDAQVIILQEPLCVLVPGNILYVSENMELRGKDQAKLPDDTQIPYENAQVITESYGYVMYSAK